MPTAYPPSMKHLRSLKYLNETNHKKREQVKYREKNPIQIQMSGRSKEINMAKQTKLRKKRTKK